MMRYFFHIYDGGITTDHDGLELPDDAAVRVEAMRTLPEIARDAVPKDGDKQGFMVLVTDEAGQHVYSATLTYAGVRLR